MRKLSFGSFWIFCYFLHVGFDIDYVTCFSLHNSVIFVLMGLRCNLFHYLFFKIHVSSLYLLRWRWTNLS